MSAREAILQTIRQAVPAGGPTPEAGYRDIPRDYHASSPATREEILALFAERLADYNAIVHQCTEAQLAATIGAILKDRAVTSLMIPRGIPAPWLPTGVLFTVDQDATYAALDACSGVLSDCAVAIALTGTIVLHHTAEQGRRALSLIPDYHLCVVRSSQIVATVPEGIRRMAQLEPKLLTTISGPSATSDIEMTRVKGVHGPRTLEVILLND